MIDRTKGKLVIEKIGKPASIEKKIFQLSECQNDYDSYIYQVAFDATDIEKLGWKNNVFDNISERISEQNEFICNPFEVEEGVFQCKAIDPKTGKICGSRRVFSYAKQDRSCDEGTSVYCQCVACKAKWRERG